MTQTLTVDAADTMKFEICNTAGQERYLKGGHKNNTYRYIKYIVSLFINSQSLLKQMDCFNMRSALKMTTTFFPHETEIVEFVPLRVHS